VDGGRSPQHIAQLVAAQLHCLDLVDGVGQVAACPQEVKVYHFRLSEVAYNHSVHSVVMVFYFLFPSEGCTGYQVTDLPFEHTLVLVLVLVHLVDRHIAARRGAQPSMNSS